MLVNVLQEVTVLSARELVAFQLLLCIWVVLIEKLEELFVKHDFTFDLLNCC